MEQSMHSTVAESAGHEHAKTANPIIVYAILAVCTVIEVGLTVFSGLPRATLVPVLLSISFVKASLVALYYMHLRYEKAIYGIVFVIPASFAIFLITVLLS
jgi:cytochrome c oxidase subunit IV